jgi:hypothetical protein
LDDGWHVESDAVIRVSFFVSINFFLRPQFLLLFLHSFVIGDLNFNVVRVVVIVEVGVRPLEIHLAVDVCGSKTATVTIACCPWGKVEVRGLNWLWHFSELRALTSVIDWVVHIVACVFLVEERRRSIVQRRS